MDVGNTFMIAELLLGPLATVFRYFNENFLGAEYKDNPQLVLSYTQARISTSFPWLQELLSALLQYGGMTKPVLTPSDLETMGVHPGQNSKWLCAKKVTLPGHLSTPIQGQQKAQSFFAILLSYHALPELHISFW
jgi:hypothetical protein